MRGIEVHCNPVAKRESAGVLDFVDHDGGAGQRELVVGVGEFEAGKHHIRRKSRAAASREHEIAACLDIQIRADRECRAVVLDGAIPQVESGGGWIVQFKPFAVFIVEGFGVGHDFGEDDLPGFGMRKAADVGNSAAAAGLGSGAGAATDGAAATIGNCSTIQARGACGERRTAADIVFTATAAGQGSGAGAAVERATTTVGHRPAVETKNGAGGRRTTTNVVLAAAAAGLGSVAGAAVEGLAATIGNRTTFRAFGHAGGRHARPLSAYVGRATAATRLGTAAGSATEGAAATIGVIAAIQARGACGERLAGAGVIGNPRRAVVALRTVSLSSKAPIGPVVIVRGVEMSGIESDGKAIGAGGPRRRCLVLHFVDFDGSAGDGHASAGVGKDDVAVMDIIRGKSRLGTACEGDELPRPDGEHRGYRMRAYGLGQHAPLQRIRGDTRVIHFEPFEGIFQRRILGLYMSSVMTRSPAPGTGKGFPQTLGVPPPPQVSGAVQLPQSRVPPQPLGTEPQLAPTALHVVANTSTDIVLPTATARLRCRTASAIKSATATVGHRTAVAPTALHVEAYPQILSSPRRRLRAVQLPQSSVPSHPLEMVPHSALHLHVVGVQVPSPQTLGVPLPPQVSGAVHCPQSISFPQPSDSVPQLAPADARDGRTGASVIRTAGLRRRAASTIDRRATPIGNGAAFSAFSSQVMGTQASVLPPDPPDALLPPVPALPPVPPLPPLPPLPPAGLSVDSPPAQPTTQGTAHSANIQYRFLLNIFASRAWFPHGLARETAMG